MNAIRPASARYAQYANVCAAFADHVNQCDVCLHHWHTNVDPDAAHPCDQRAAIQRNVDSAMEAFIDGSV